MYTAAALQLRDGDRARLESLTRASTVKAGLATRARIVLLAAVGMPNTDIADRTGTTRRTVLEWRGRYQDCGIEGLDDDPRPGRAAVIDEIAVLSETLADRGKPPAHLGVTHWSARLMATRLGISFASVARIWRKWNIQPHRVETFKFSTDPELEAKLREVVGLYLDPPKGAVVVSVDEKSQIQALDRSQPILPPRSRGNHTSASGSSWPVSSSLSLGTTPNGSATRKPSQNSVAWPHSPPAADEPPAAIASAAAATAKPTVPSTSSLSCDYAITSRPALTSNDVPTKDSAKERSSGASSATSPGRSTPTSHDHKTTH